MVLQLKYNEHINLPAAAAFIRGNDPMHWLRTMQGWKVAPEDLTCMILSVNNDPHAHAGLFVIFHAGKVPPADKLMHPYAVAGHKLYIPVHATLFPAMSAEELKSVLIWDYQIFHPTYGFFGFETTDLVKLEDLLRYPVSKQADWDYAMEGDLPAPSLQRINMESPTADEMFEKEKEQVGNKNIEDIPKDKKTKIPQWLDVIIKPLLTVAFKIISGILKLLPVSTIKTEQSLLQKLQGWMGTQLEDLEARRDSELNRLLSLFEKNAGDALNYAIPLASRYLDRGKAPQGGKLGWRSLNFNLGNLGGGIAADGWDIGNYYDKLRANYLKAAEAAERDGDYKKAAYVHAHLLADYQAAAKTLVRGKYFREAAALYKDHLKNLPAAAECLEEGGLYLEAIEVYIELERDEKTGDLYTLLEQKDNADKFYHKCIKHALGRNDYLEAARLHTDKMQDENTARSLLLDGWKNTNRSGDCLHKYFELMGEDKLPAAMKQIYTQHTTPERNNELLRVMSGVVKKYKSEALQETSRNIAYEIASTEAAEGKNDSLLLLRDFMERDGQLMNDCYKFISKQRIILEKADAGFGLVEDINWFQVIAWQDQVLALGYKSTGLYLARCNTKKQIEYHSWSIPFAASDYIRLIANDKYSDQVILLTTNESLTDKILPASVYFQHELKISVNPEWVPDQCLNVIFIEDGFAGLYPELNHSILLMFDAGASIKCPVEYSLDHKLMYIGGNFVVVTNDAIFHLDEGEFWNMHKTGLISYSAEGSFFNSDKIAIYSPAVGGMVWDVNNLSGRHVIFDKARPSVSGIEFVAKNIIAVINENIIYLYDIEDGNAQLLTELKGPVNVQQVIPGIARDAFGILDVKGNITVHEI